MRKPTDGLLIDDALVATGSRGRHQQLIFALAFLAGMPNAFIALHFVFSQFEPVHHCTFPEDFINLTTKNETTRNEIISTIIPLESDQYGKLIPSQCKMYLRNYSDYPVHDWPNVFGEVNGTDIVDCMFGSTYKQDEDKETATMKFSMVCNDDWKAPLAVSMYQVGLTIGSIFGVTADWWGRRPVFVLGCIFQVVGQIFNVVSWNFSSYCASILIGAASGFMNYVISFVIVTEITDKNMRNFMAIASFYSFSIGYCIVTLAAYVFQQWRWMLGIMAVLSTVIYAPCCFLIPESPRWLAQRGKSDQAIELLRTIAKMNGKKEIFEEELRIGGNRIVEKQGTPSTGTMETLRVLFKSGLEGRFLASVYGWTVSSMLYFAVAIYSEDFSTDRYINFFLSGVTEIPAYLVSVFLVKHIGRPRTAFALMMISGFSSFTLPFIPKDLPLLSTVIAIIGKAAIAGVFYAWYLISCEVIPTLQRSSGVAVCSGASRIGSYFAPYLMYTRKYNYFAANIVLGTMAVSCALTGIFFVPETLGVDVPDTVAEAKQNQRKQFDLKHIGSSWNRCIAIFIFVVVTRVTCVFNNCRFYGLKLGKKFSKGKKKETNISKTSDGIGEKETML